MRFCGSRKRGGRRGMGREGIKRDEGDEKGA